MLPLTKYIHIYMYSGIFFSVSSKNLGEYLSVSQQLSSRIKLSAPLMILMMLLSFHPSVSTCIFNFHLEKKIAHKSDKKKVFLLSQGGQAVAPIKTNYNNVKQEDSVNK